MSHHLDGSVVYVALLLPHTDGSGEAAVLGVYETPEEAEARCWRAIQRIGYEQPTGVVSRIIGSDEADPAERGSLTFECREWAKSRIELAL